MENLFGYLFAKAAEMEYAETHRTASINYSPSDCWAGEIRSDLDEKGQEALGAAKELGRQFYSDLKFYSECNPDEVYEDNMLRALILIQMLRSPITREQFCVMLKRYDECQEISRPPAGAIISLVGDFFASLFD